MKKEELEFNHDFSTDLIYFEDMNGISEIPFSITFKHDSKEATITFVNGNDIFKLADIVAEMLKKNDIDCTVYKNDYSKEK